MDFRQKTDAHYTIGFEIWCSSYHSGYFVGHTQGIARAAAHPSAPARVYILQRGVQWKQGVVVYMTLYTIWLHNTTPIHCTPDPLHPPLQSIQRGRLCKRAMLRSVFIISNRIYWPYASDRRNNAHALLWQGRWISNIVLKTSNWASQILKANNLFICPYCLEFKIARV